MQLVSVKNLTHRVKDIGELEDGDPIGIRITGDRKMLGWLNGTVKKGGFFANNQYIRYFDPRFDAVYTLPPLLLEIDRSTREAS